MLVVIKEDSLMRGGLCRKETCTVTLLHRRPSIVDRTAQQSSIDSQLFAQNRDLCLPHLHSTPPLEGPRQNIAMAFGVEKLEWFGYPSVEKFEDTVTRFDRIH